MAEYYYIPSAEWFIARNNWHSMIRTPRGFGGDSSRRLLGTFIPADNVAVHGEFISVRIGVHTITIGKHQRIKMRIDGDNVMVTEPAAVMIPADPW